MNVILRYNIIIWSFGQRQDCESAEILCLILSYSVYQGIFSLYFVAVFLNLCETAAR